MKKYLEISGKAMLAAALTYDHARAAEKMADWSCVGDDNIAWKEGPYLSTHADQKQIDHNYPYCFRSSDEFAVIAGIIMGPNPEKNEFGAVTLPIPPKGENESRVEPVISKLAIIEQFELLKEFLATFDGPFNKKNCQAWEGKVDQEVLDTVICLVNRRNELTHGDGCSLPSMKEAVAYFYQSRELARELFEAKT